METKHKMRASVRLSEQAHSLLVDIAEKNKVSMKTVGSQAIHRFDNSSKRERDLRTHIEQLKFAMKKRAQVAIVCILMASLGMGLMGFIIGVSI